jgi:hypothetical protein
MNNLSVPQNSPFSTSQSLHFSRQMINSSNEHNKIYDQYSPKHQAKHPSTERCYQLSTPTYSFTRSISPSYGTNVDNNNNVNVSMNNIIQNSPIGSVASKSGTPSTISIHSSQSVATTPLNSNNMNLIFLPNIKIPSFNVGMSGSPQNEASTVSSLVTISNIFQTPSPLTISPNFYNTSTISTTPINNIDIPNFNPMINNNCDNGNNIHQNQNNNIKNNNNNYYYQNQDNNYYQSQNNNDCFHQNQNNNYCYQNQNNNYCYQNQNNNCRHQNQNFNLQFSSANSPTTVPRAILPCQIIENSVVLSQQQTMFNPIFNSTCLMPTSLNMSSNSSSPIGILPSKTSTICEKVSQSSNYNVFDVNENKQSPSISSVTTHSPSPNVDINNNNCKNSYDNENNNINGEKSKTDNNNNVHDHNTSPCVKQNWTCEQEKLGNSLYQKLKPKCLSRTGKLVGMMLEGYRDNHNYLNVLIGDNEKLLFDKIAVLNKILDDSEKIANIN